MFVVVVYDNCLCTVHSVAMRPWRVSSSAVRVSMIDWRQMFNVWLPATCHVTKIVIVGQLVKKGCSLSPGGSYQQSLIFLVACISFPVLLLVDKKSF